MKELSTSLSLQAVLSLVLGQYQILEHVVALQLDIKWFTDITVTYSYKTSHICVCDIVVLHGSFCPWTFSLSWMELVLFRFLYVMLRFFTNILYRRIQGFATHCPCCGWCSLACCILVHFSEISLKLQWVCKFDMIKSNFSIVFNHVCIYVVTYILMFYIHLFIFASQIMIYFLSCTWR